MPDINEQTKDEIALHEEQAERLSEEAVTLIERAKMLATLEGPRG